MNNPRTIEDARATVYGRWSGNQDGHPYREGYCAFKVIPDGWVLAQCSRKAVTGPSSLYCRQHAAMVEAQS